VSFKEDINDVAEELKEIKEEHSLAYVILQELKKENKTIKILLGLSIIANILMAIALIIK
jgi:predicted CopG family antitoxin